MRTKKALKRLDKVESLLSSIFEHYDINGQRSLQETLVSARKSVIRAKETADRQKAKLKTARKPPAKAAAASQNAAGVRGQSRVRAAAAGQ